ncbi:MAG: HAD hydrolase-like protein, partial [Candidatus Eisenbacteria bacterium]
MMQPTRAALFDIDGTLIHGQGSGRRAFLHALEAMTGREIDDHGFSFAGRTDLEILRELQRRNGLAESSGTETARFVELYCARLAEELRLIGGASTYAGVIELLDAMNDGSWAIGLLTGNLREGARRKLE